MHDGQRPTADGGIPSVHLLTERVSLDTYCSTIYSNENGASLIIRLVMSVYFMQSELYKKKREILMACESCSQRNKSIYCRHYVRSFRLLGILFVVIVLWQEF